MSQNKGAHGYNVPVMTLSERKRGKYETNKEGPPRKFCAN